MFYDEQNEEDRAEKGVNENLVGGSIIVFCLSVGFVVYFTVKIGLALWHFWVG